MASSHAYRASLIVPCFQGEFWIAKCLESIAAQTLDRAEFEVIVVVNGPIDGSPAVVEEILGGRAGLNFRIAYSDVASVSNARNVGIEDARGVAVTWVDVDDWLSPNYLEELVRAMAGNTVPVAQVVDVSELSGAFSVSPITEQVLSHEPGLVDPAVLWRPLGFAACKLLPTVLAREKLFDVSLRSGEDVAYFAPFMAEHDLKFDTTPAHAGAIYYRLVRSSSLSRQEPSFDFLVTQRIAVMAHLDRARSVAAAPIADVMRSLMNSQALFVAQYLESHPEEYPRVRESLLSANLNYIPRSLAVSRAPD